MKHLFITSLNIILTVSQDDWNTCTSPDPDGAMITEPIPGMVGIERLINETIWDQIVAGN